MKLNIITIHFIEWVLISLMAYCGSYCFTSSNLYVLMQSPIASHYPGLNPYLPEIIWGILFIFGFQSVILRKKGGGVFTWLVVIVSLPSILSSDSINIFNIFGLNIKAVSKINYYGLLGLGASIMVGYVLLNHMSIYKQTRLSLSRRKADIGDIEEVNTRSHFFLLIAIAATILAVTLLALLTRGLETLFLPLLNRLSWNAALIGLGCVFILAILIYWMGSQRKSGSGD
jgi:hypothetical protein